MTPPVSYGVRGEHSSPRFARAFAAGCGGDVAYASGGIVPDTDFAAFCTPPLYPLLKHAQDAGRTWYYGDHAYLGSRGGQFRVTKNGYQCTTTDPNATPDRFERLGLSVQPWRRSGAHVLVCPNSRAHGEQHGFDMQDWTDRTAATLAHHTDRPIRVKYKSDPWPIRSELVDCWAVVVYSSAAALDALMCGIPVFVGAPWAAAAQLGQCDLAQIEAPWCPDHREQVLWTLAARQWTVPEITSGVAWEAVR